MHSPLSFFIFCDEYSLLCCFDPPWIFRTTLNSSKIFWMYCCLFILFFSDAFFMRLLRSFNRCFSSLGVLLLSSMKLKISASLSRNSSLSFAAADVVPCASLLSFLNSLALLLEWNTMEPASSTWSGTCAPRCSSELCSRCSSPSGRCFGSRSPAPQFAAAAAAISCIDFVCIFFTSDSHKRVWALILQSLPCHPVTFTAFLSIITSTGCRRPPVLTSMLELNSTTPLVCYFAAALHASPFDLLCYNFNKCAFCFCCCGVLSFDLIFRVISCVMYFSFFFWRLAFLLCQRFLDMFPRTRTLQYWCSLLFTCVQHTQSSHVFRFLSWHGCSFRALWSRK